jgi:predicted DCC family thiol-disulfide oxidoreductase YuxK
MDTREIVIFDGTCNLCANGVSFILAHERDHQLQFAAAQSEPGQALLIKSGLDPQDISTFVFIKGDEVHVRSDAAIKVAHHLRLPWRMLALLRILPRRFRDSVYDLVAQRRHRWFGTRESCRRPTPELRSRFVEYDES